MLFDKVTPVRFGLVQKAPGPILVTVLGTLGSVKSKAPVLPAGYEIKVTLFPKTSSYMMPLSETYFVLLLAIDVSPVQPPKEPAPMPVTLFGKFVPHYSL